MGSTDSWHLQDPNAVNESFWDAHGVEIEACAIFEHFVESDKIYNAGIK